MAWISRICTNLPKLSTELLKTVAWNSVIVLPDNQPPLLLHFWHYATSFSLLCSLSRCHPYLCGDLSFSNTIRSFCACITIYAEFFSIFLVTANYDIKCYNATICFGTSLSWHHGFHCAFTFVLVGNTVCRLYAALILNILCLFIYFDISIAACILLDAICLTVFV